MKKEKVMAKEQKMNSNGAETLSQLKPYAMISDQGKLEIVELSADLGICSVDDLAVVRLRDGFYVSPIFFSSANINRALKLPAKIFHKNEKAHLLFVREKDNSPMKRFVISKYLLPKVGDVVEYADDQGKKREGYVLSCNASYLKPNRFYPIAELK